MFFVARKRFVRNVIRYLRTYGFDGFDMDWEFPGTRGSPASDKYRFTFLMQVCDTRGSPASLKLYL